MEGWHFVRKGLSFFSAVARCLALLSLSHLSHFSVNLVTQNYFGPRILVGVPSARVQRF